MEIKHSITNLENDNTSEIDLNPEIFGVHVKKNKLLQSWSDGS